MGRKTLMIVGALAALWWFFFRKPPMNGAGA